MLCVFPLKSWRRVSSKMNPSSFVSMRMKKWREPALRASSSSAMTSNSSKTSWSSPWWWAGTHINACISMFTHGHADTYCNSVQLNLWFLLNLEDKKKKNMAKQSFNLAHCDTTSSSNNNSNNNKINQNHRSGWNNGSMWMDSMDRCVCVCVCVRVCVCARNIM